MLQPNYQTALTREILVKHIKAYHESSPITVIDELMESLSVHKKDFARDRNWVISQLRAFESFGLCKIIEGRHGKKSRVDWGKKPTEINDRQFHLEPAARMISHSFSLRASVPTIVKLDAPEDITPVEAGRVIAWVEGLLPQGVNR